MRQRRWSVRSVCGREVDVLFLSVQVLVWVFLLSDRPGSEIGIGEVVVDSFPGSGKIESRGDRKLFVEE